MMKAKGLLLVFSTLLLASQAFAGWVMEEVTTDIEGNKTTKTRYVQNNKVKDVGPEEITMLDLEKNLFYMISPSPEYKVYWCGTPEQMQKEMEETRKKMEEEYLKKMSPEQREAYKQYQEKMKGETKEPAKGKKLKVEVKKTSETTTIAGYPTRKYQVWVNGELKEEKWISKKIKPTDEIDLEKLEKFLKAMSGPEAEESYESSPDYMHLMEIGAEMKTIGYHEEGSEITEMEKIEKKKIPYSEFEVPKGYRKLSLFELQQLQKTMKKKEEK
jgi:hypothetical protein